MVDAQGFLSPHYRGHRRTWVIAGLDVESAGGRLFLSLSGYFLFPLGDDVRDRAVLGTRVSELW